LFISQRLHKQRTQGRGPGFIFIALLHCHTTSR